MTLLMCKFVDEEMEQDLMQEKVLFKPTNKEEKSEKVNSDAGIDSSSDKVSIDETAPPVEEELPSSEDDDLEGDGGDKTKASKQELVKKRKSPEKPSIEEDKISPTKKSKDVVDDQLPPIRPEQDDVVDQVKDLDEDVYVNVKVSTEIGEKLKDEFVTNEIINNANKDDTLFTIPGSESGNIPNESDEVISEGIESVEENNVESDSKDHAPSTDESEPLHNANEIGQNEMDQNGEKNNLDDSDGKQATTKESADTENSIDTPENPSDSQTSSGPNNKKDDSAKDSTQNDQNDDVDQENKMNEAVKPVDKELDFSPNEQNHDTDQVEDMDESELLADPAILEAIKLSEITASKEIDGAVAEAEEMEEEESEEEPEEPFKKEEYKIYSNMKEFSTLRQPRKAFMKTFRKELASIRFNSTTDPTPQEGLEQKKASEKDETVPSEVNFLLNVGLAPNPPSTTSSKDKEEQRLRRLDKISKLSNKAKLRMGRRSLARLEDRFRSNLIRTVQQNTEVSTLCKEMLILDLNPTKYLWGSALLRKRELSKKLKDWFKQAKLAEAEEMKNPSSSNDNPSLPSKLLRFTSCDTISSAPRLLLSIKIGKAGLDLKWHSTADQADFSLLATRHYELQCSHAQTPWDQPSEWKTIGNIKAMPLPMACTIRKFESGHIYSFKIRAVKSKKDRSEWSEPVSIAL